ncbi:Protein MAIN-LIKE 1 [Glycine soja]
MVRTRGLGRALGRVIDRALGREDHCHSDDVSQRRRPTTSAHRQREAASVAKDAPDVADVTEDVFRHAKEVVDDAEGFLDGSCDPLVMTAYGDHVAVIVWNEEVQKFGRPTPEIEGLVAATRLNPLIACSVDTGNQGLIYAFVERWHKETSSFHLPVGEVTITLDDVASLLHLPSIGAFHNFKTLHVNEAVLMLVELLEVSREEVKAETVQCHGAYVHLLWLRYIYQSKCEAEHWTVAACAYLLHLLGCTLFANKSATHVHCWIYEHFSSIVESLTDPDYDEMSPYACRWISTKAFSKSLLASMYRKRLDGLTIVDVYWMPYDDHRIVWDFDLISCFSCHIRWGPVVAKHRLERVVGQFGYVQTIPPQTTGSMLSFEDIDDKWMHFSDYLAPIGQICVVLRQCASDYMHWFFMISHPFMTPTQLADLVRHPSVTQDDTYVEPHIPEVLVAPATTPAHAPSDVE